MASKKYPKNKPITIPIQKFNIKKEFKKYDSKRILRHRLKNDIKDSTNGVL